MALLDELTNEIAGQTVNPNAQDSNPAVNLLGGISQRRAANPVGPANQLTTQDMLNYIPPEYEAAIGAQNQSTYFPAINQPVGVGSSSTRSTGSTTLFAVPGAVPFGLMDAREKALQDAAAQKVARDDDFMAAIRAGEPITKRGNVQKDLSNSYWNYVNKSVNDAKGMYGDRALDVLKRDPTFYQGLANFRALKENEDYAVGLAANVRKREEEGDFVAPELKEALGKFESGVYGMATGENAGAVDLQRTLAEAKFYDDLDTRTNTFLKEFTPTITQKVGTFTKNGIYDVAEITKEKFFDEAELDKAANDMYNLYYKGQKYITPESIKRNLQQKIQHQIEKEVKTQANQFAPSSYVTTEEVSILDGGNHEIETTVVTQGEGGVGSGVRKSGITTVGYAPLNEKMQQDINLATGTEMFEQGPDGKMVKVKTPSSGTYRTSAIFVAPTYKGSGIMVPREGLSGGKLSKVPKKLYDWQAMVQVTPLDPKGNPIPNKAVYLPLKAAKSSIASENRTSSTSKTKINVESWENEAVRMNKDGVEIDSENFGAEKVPDVIVKEGERAAKPVAKPETKKQEEGKKDWSKYQRK